MLLVLCGKSCSGKDTIKKELVKMGMKTVVTYTTRPPRENETDGVDYHFITKREFQEKDLGGFFMETTSYNVGMGETWYYGSAKEDFTDDAEDKVIIVNPFGLSYIRAYAPVNPIVFYLMASEETRRDRLNQRGDSESEMERRLKADDRDFKDFEERTDFMFKTDAGLRPEWLADMIMYTYNNVVKEVKNMKAQEAGHGN